MGRDEKKIVVNFRHRFSSQNTEEPRLVHLETLRGFPALGSGSQALQKPFLLDCWSRTKLLRRVPTPDHTQTFSFCFIHAREENVNLTQLFSYDSTLQQKELKWKSETRPGGSQETFRKQLCFYFDSLPAAFHHITTEMYFMIPRLYKRVEPATHLQNKSTLHVPHRRSLVTAPTSEAFLNKTGVALWNTIPVGIKRLVKWQLFITLHTTVVQMFVRTRP